MDDALPLAGLKVLDLSRLLPGPYATLVLADMGAEVVKVEHPREGDSIRQMAPFFGEEGAFFYALNRNKRSLALDLKTPEGVLALRRLVGFHDVLVESFRPGVMERLGLSYAALSQDNPRLIYCSITGYGQTGPDRLKAGHDLNYVARAGVLGSSGVPGGPVVPIGAQVADVGGGSLFAVSGILAALYARERSGRGRHLDISMTEGAMAFVHMHLAARLLTGHEPSLQPGHNPLNGALPGYGVYATSDGRHLAIGALEPRFFEGVCEVLGKPEWLGPAYEGGEAAARVKEDLARVIASQPLHVWLERFSGRDVCVEPVLDADEVFQDSQLSARGVVVERDDTRRARRVRHLRTPLSPEGSAAVRHPPPRLGEHSREVLKAAGFTDEECLRLGAV